MVDMKIFRRFSVPKAPFKITTPYTHSITPSKDSRQSSLLSKSSVETSPHSESDNTSFSLVAASKGPQDDGLTRFSSPESILRPQKSEQSSRKTKSKWHGSSLQTFLELALVIGESSDIPYLKGLAGIILIVVEAVRVTKDNEELCSQVLRMVTEIAAVIEETGSLDEPSYMGMSLQSLFRCCETITKALKDHSKRKFGIRLVNASRDSDLLKKCDKELRNALGIFRTKMAVGTSAAVKRAQTLDQEMYTEVTRQLRSVKENLFSETQPVPVTAIPIPEQCLPSAETALPVTVTTYTLPEAQSAPVTAIPVPEQCLSSADIALPVTVATYTLPNDSPDLPVAPQIFYGREDELKRLEELFLDGKPAHAVICGPVGVGKSALAQSLLHRPAMERVFEHRRYYVDCESLEELSQLRSTLAELLGIEAATVEDIHTCLAMVNTNLLIVLDNLDSLWEPLETRLQVETFLAELSVNAVSLLVTLSGTQRPSGPNWTKPYLPALSPLGLSSARDLFFAIADVADTDDEVNTVDHLLLDIDCLPRAITILATLAQSEPLSFLKERFLEEGVDMLTANSGLGDKAFDMKTNFEKSLTSSRMEACPHAIDVLRALAETLDPPGLGRNRGVPRQEFVKSLKDRYPTVHRCLSVLLETSLISYDAACGELRLSRLMQEYLLRSLGSG